MMLAAVSFADPARKPPVPVGVDPGGVLVALIGEGIDYTNPDISRRLARDGEGELIGWDFVDGDRRPFLGQTHILGDDLKAKQTVIALLVVQDNAAVRLSIFRIPSWTELASTGVSRLRADAGLAIDTASKAKAKIIALTLSGLHGSAHLATSASQRYPDALILLGSDGLTPSALNELALSTNVVTIQNNNSDCVGLNSDRPSPSVAEIEVKSPCFKVGDYKFALADTSVARAAALAARILASDPKLTGAELKLRLAALATPTPLLSGHATVYGRIDDPAGVMVGVKKP